MAGAVCTATLFVAGADGPRHIGDAPEAAVAAPPPSPAPEMHLMAAEPPPPPPPAPLPHGVAKETGLQVDTILTARAVSATFPEILDIGGVRSDPLKWHPHGLAIDVMIPNAGSPEGRALGDRVLAYVMENAERFGLVHAIWRQTIYKPDGSSRLMANRGSATANHYDHVHIATEGGGFPAEGQTYLR
ncbi:hypothetical protein [Mycolicibacterium pulveris]|uniref:hypothetical protein n=1 Tax=Mycolicibacterium pulveris TaxID=36813 RepID=UPI003CF90C8C